MTDLVPHHRPVTIPAPTSTTASPIAPPPPVHRRSLLARLLGWLMPVPRPVEPVVVKISPETEQLVDDLCATLGADPKLEDRMQLELFFESLDPRCPVVAVGGGSSPAGREVAAPKDSRANLRLPTRG